LISSAANCDPFKNSFPRKARGPVKGNPRPILTGSAVHPAGAAGLNKKDPTTRTKKIIFIIFLLSLRGKCLGVNFNEKFYSRIGWGELESFFITLSSTRILMAPGKQNEIDYILPRNANKEISSWAQSERRLSLRSVLKPNRPLLASHRQG
jgi:hypothetical protein